MSNNLLMVKFWQNSKDDEMQKGLWVDTVRSNGGSFAIIVDDQGKIKDIPIKLVQVLPPKSYNPFIAKLKEGLEKKDQDNSLCVDLT